jgi:outer membrane protein assembly factor BamB
MSKNRSALAVTGFLAAATLLWSCGQTVPDVSTSSLEWSQWRGPNRDGISTETGLLKSWPDGGPEVVWRVALGSGFSGIAISADRLYTMLADSTDEYVVCLDAASGEEIWRVRSDSTFVEGQGYGNGPRSTPTVDGDLLFALSAHGKLHALNAGSGEKLWQRDFVGEFGSTVPQWGFSTSPLIEGNQLIVEVGGEGEQSIVSFAKRTGEVQWTSHSDEAAYSSPIAISSAGHRQIIFLTSKNLISVSPRDGRVFWAYPWLVHHGIAVSTPIYVPDDRIFVASSYDYGNALLEISSVGDGLAVSERWKNRSMENHYSSSVLHGKHLYGFDDSILKCIEVETGAERWKTRGPGKGSLILADGHLLVLGGEGELVLAEATPQAYRVKASVQILEGACWTPPSLSGGKLYIRNLAEMICLDLKGGKS